MPSGLPPLVVDLDGTLISGDTLLIGAVRAFRADALLPLRSVAWLWKGRANLKSEIASRVDLDVTRLPYRRSLVEYLEIQREAGRAVYLATAAHRRVATPIAAHLGIFADVFASTGPVNLKGEAKADRLVQEFGQKGFVYAGNSRSDLPIWREAAAAILVGVPPRVARQAAKLTRIEGRFDC